MGVYDIFYYNCPSCGKYTNSQTKLGECSLLNLTIGCEFLMDGKILMKNPCEHCDENSVVVIENGIIMRFTKKDEAIFEESDWGGCEKIEDTKIHEEGQ